MAAFRERGYDATSMEQLATAAGISKAAFYHHVSGKEQLLAVGMDRALVALELLLSEIESHTGDALSRLAYLLRRVVELEHDLLAEVTVMLRARGNSTVETEALTRRRAFDRRFAELISEGQIDGTVRRDLDPLLASRLVIGMATWLVEWYRPEGQLGLQLVAEHVVAITLNGLASPTSRPTSTRATHELQSTQLRKKM